MITLFGIIFVTPEVVCLAAKNKTMNWKSVVFNTQFRPNTYLSDL